MVFSTQESSREKIVSKCFVEVNRTEKLGKAIGSEAERHRFGAG
jgi:hypothetical protein